MGISCYFWIIRVVNSQLTLYRHVTCNPPWHPLKYPPNDNKRFQLWQVIFSLNTSTQNLAEEHTLADGPPQESSLDVWNTATPNLADKPTLADGTPQYQSRDDLHTTTQNLADEPTLAEHNDKGLKALAFTVSEIPHSIFSKHIFA